MKKELFILSLIISMYCCFNTSCNSASLMDTTYPIVLDRKDTIGTSEEINRIYELYKTYTTALVKDSNDDLSRIKLIELYINEARVTGNLGYYNHAAMKMLNSIVEKQHVKAEILYKALTYKATVYMSLHQFEAAKKVAEQAIKMNPFEADIYGVLMDAYVELGDYENAVKMSDKMMAIRPDIRSYSRVSYLRQIFGDNQGAIAAMRMAVESGAQGMENTEWARVQLGDLYLNTGHADTAKMLYESSLFVRPGYPYAEMGLAKVAASQKQYDTAISHCKKAIVAMSESAFVSYLGDLYKKNGEHEKANEVHKDVLNLMLENEKENEKEQLAKHNGNRELANAFLSANQYDEALAYAKKDLAIRPENIDANELVGWIYYLKNDMAHAKIYIDKAMRTHSQNAALLYKASLIYEGVAERIKADEMKNQSLQINPALQPENFVAIN